MNIASFNDFDAYAEAIRNAQVDVQLLHVHERFWRIAEARAGCLRLQYGAEGSGFLAQGSMAAEGWGIYTKQTGAPIPVNGQILDSESIFLLPPRSEFRFAGQGAVQWLSIFVPESLIAPIVSSSDAWPSGRVVHVGQDLARELSQLGKTAFSLGSDHNSTELEQLVQSTIAAAVSNAKVTNTTSQRRNQIITRALELVRGDSGHELTVSSLAYQIGTSQRNLLSAFREQLGMSPQAYIINYKLHQAYRRLKSADHRTVTISSIVTDVGFTDFGRFSRRYHHLFGELPSATLRRREHSSTKR